MLAKEGEQPAMNYSIRTESEETAEVGKGMGQTTEYFIFLQITRARSVI